MNCIFESPNMMKKYFTDIADGIKMVWQGMSITFKHLKDARKSHSASNVQDKNYFLQDTGIVTLQYPYEKLPVPDHGRYQLHNEMDDCIVCDKCAVICPVDCIDIEPIKSSEPIGTTSDGSVKRLYAAKFDIDMAKCCFCGLCTSVCPTECLTMTNQYDFSVYNVKEMNFEFANLTKEQAQEKRLLYEQFTKEKEEAKQKLAAEKVASPAEQVVKPAFKPMIKPAIAKPIIENTESTNAEIAKPVVPKPVGLKPIIKPVIAKVIDETNAEIVKPSIPKPAGLKPIIKPIIKKPDNNSND